MLETPVGKQVTIQSQTNRTPQRNEGVDVNIDVRMERSMTPDSYTMATKVGQSIAAAFLKLGSHSQEIALSSSAPNWDEKQFYHSLRVDFVFLQVSGCVVEKDLRKSFLKSEFPRCFVITKRRS